MALIKDTNSFATVAEADAYFTEKLDVAAWTDADETTKAQALVSASQILDEQTWSGVIADEAQPMAFPRVGSYFDPRLGYSTVFGSITPLRVVTATLELAYHLLNNDGIQDSTGSVVNLSIGSVRLDRIISTSLIPTHVKSLIKPMLKNGGTRMWWRNN
jgi:hypothetical protein